MGGRAAWRHGWRAHAGLSALVAAAMGAGAAWAGDVRGKVTLVDARQRPLRHPPAAVVCLESSAGGAPERSSTTPLSIQTRGKQFQPGMIAVSVGSTVRFPNGDSIQHNVFSVSPGNAFDLGLYGNGDGKSVTFKTPGVVRVFCNVHPQMSAVIFVCPSPHFAPVGTDGSFAVSNVPPGRYTAKAWNDRGEEAVAPVEVTASGATAVELTLMSTARRSPSHLNKDGQPYSDFAEGEY